ncbi:MAG: nucleotidyltransferase [bacterium]|nr:nucleotidyltransferase [bacterium]
MDLVIMAAGMGSRFGGLKQIEPIDEHGNFIIDYSIFDAIRFGFDRVIFIIKEENYDIFRSTVGKRIENRIKVEYVFQKGLSVNPTRVKPWGTAHAILCCKDVVKDNFAVINADDFYGEDAFRKVSDYLKSLDKTSNNYALVGYVAQNTLSENGSAKRGICEVKDGYLTKIVESSVEKVNNKILATPLLGGETFEVRKDQTVSMNMFAFTPELFKHLESGFDEFLSENQDNLEKCEYLIPEVVENLVKTNQASVKIVNTSAVWYGVTYKEDKENVVSSIKNLVKNGVYPEGLW